MLLKLFKNMLRKLKSNVMFNGELNKYESYQPCSILCYKNIPNQNPEES